jgi:hypothetical protein
VSAAGAEGAEHEAKQPEQDADEFLRRLRTMPADQVIRDTLLGLLQAAQVKLGRRDARLLIDVAAVAHDHARRYLPGDLTSQIDEILGQLRMGQVSAEGQASQPGPAEENDLENAPAPPPG